MEGKWHIWDTAFNTSENLMIHVFSDRVKVASNIKTGAVRVLKDGEVINIIEDPTIDDYEKLLISVFEDARQLEKFRIE